MDFSFLAEYYPYFLYGTIITLIISVVTIIIGTIIGILMALAKLSSITPLRWIANI
ncbi:MAG: amino acid ABC transporter permease, partial [Enterococcus sp.]